jgi:hypothetical protein
LCLRSWRNRKERERERGRKEGAHFSFSQTYFTSKERKRKEKKRKEKKRNETTRVPKESLPSLRKPDEAPLGLMCASRHHAAVGKSAIVNGIKCTDHC